ncbi:hypothetical protein [Demequina sp. NBRC 110055]|uniref:hypothetical protein n=1 Tax=Demequina sp. NBRC 110055 TaxID=1570344 RepID=UPI001185E31B|nr:hypothetical protein [Demequina sp. NBRC 110055]
MRGDDGEDDATRLSSRRIADDDVTRLALRRSAVDSTVTGADDCADDATRVASRRTPAATELTDRSVDAPALDDPASGGSSSVDDTTRTAVPSRSGRRSAPLPPGVPLGDAPAEGVFSDGRESYAPRRLPQQASVREPTPASAARSEADVKLLTTQEIAARRARERRRRVLIGAAIAAGIAAALTAVVIVAITLLGPP